MKTETDVRTCARVFPTIEGKYLSITSYRSDGTGVATPVWFVRDGGRLLVETGADSYKVKRIRCEPFVAIATCTAPGKLRGAKVAARAEILEWTPERYEPLFKQKYRIDLIFFRPIRALQKVFHIGPARSEPVLLVITPT
jgi:uncharacterized protein